MAGQAYIQHNLLGAALKTISSFPTTSSVKVTTRNPALNSSIHNWEVIHSPLKIPSDLKQFYVLCDGITCRWKVTDQAMDCGIIQVNSVGELNRFDNGIFLSENTSSSTHYSVPTLPPGPSFLLSGCHPSGKILLCFPVNSHHPQIWFHALESATWHPLSPNFTSFFRLMLVNLGIIGWPMAYTLHIVTTNYSSTNNLAAAAEAVKNSTPTTCSSIACRKRYSVNGGMNAIVLDWLNYYVPDRSKIYWQTKAKLTKICLDLNKLHLEFYSDQGHQTYEKLLRQVVTQEAEQQQQQRISCKIDRVKAIVNEQRTTASSSAIPDGTNESIVLGSGGGGGGGCRPPRPASATAGGRKAESVWR